MKDIIKDQIKTVLNNTGARWAVFLIKIDSGWEISSFYKLNKTQRKALNEFLSETKYSKWLDKISKQSKVSFRSLKDAAGKLKCEKVFAFSSKNQKPLLLVGADQLDKTEKAIFKLLVLTVSSPNVLPPLFSPAISKPVLRLDENLTRILGTLVEVIPANSAYLAIREGDYFIVEAVLDLPDKLLKTKININENKIFNKMVSTRQGLVLKAKHKGLEIFSDKEKKKPQNWLGVPIVLGIRVIGVIAYSQKEKYSQIDLDEAMALAHHIAPSVEKSIVFEEAANFLQRFALLNELSSAASSPGDMKEVTRRIKRMLQRAFKADKVSLMLLDAENKMLIEHENNAEGDFHQRLLVESSIEGAVIKIGRPIRIDNIAKQSKYTSQDSGISSKLVAPFRFRGATLGTLSLESFEIDAFSEEDEKFLVVIASQIAGIIENLQLNDETRTRAHNLLQINEIIQKILGLNKISEIAITSAQMIAQKFGYEMVLVMLLDEAHEEFIAEGVAGSGTEDVPLGFRYASNLGVPGEVLKYGKSLLIKNAAEAKNYFPIPDWDPGSEMCTPLREGDKIFGVINVENHTPDAFDENDLVVLEAIAGALSSVIMNARRYGQLQTNVLQLEAVRETALDIGKDLDLEEVMKRVVNRVKNLVAARGAELGLVDEKEKLVRVLVSENPWQDYTGYTFPLMTGIAGRIAGLGEAIAVADFNTWSGKLETDHPAPFTTVAGVPLKLSDTVIGTLTVQDDRPTRAFDAADIKILELLAPQISIFIRNARLYQELEERIEAQRLAEERVIRSAKLAAVGEMAAAVAHELNNPLTTITGFTELILESLPEDSGEHEDLSLVLKEAQRSRFVVRRLLDFSRQGEILRVESDVNEVISVVLALVHHIAQTSGVVSRIEMWDDLPLISIDRSQMQQVFLNLIHNAIQAMPEGGELLIQSQLDKREDEDWIAVIIKDSGVGISKEHIDEIFEPFFTTKPLGEGTGLGLSVSYSIVSEHGGYIDVESEEKKGSIFTVWLPVKSDAQSGVIE